MAENSPIKLFSIAWIREEDYPAFLAICEDADRFPSVWAEWARCCEETEQQLKVQGYDIKRVCIDPHTFLNWCASRGCDVNAEARAYFAAESTRTLKSVAW